MPTLTLSRQLGSSMLRFEPFMAAGCSDIADALYVGLLSADFLFEPLEPLGSAYIGKLLQVGEKRELAASVNAICRVCSAQLGSHRTETHVLHSSMHTSPHMPVD